MGKNLKGKEIGKGLCQKGDGTYLARFVNCRGKRVEKCFKTLPEARNWLDEARQADKETNALLSPEITVDKWFEFWIKNLVADLAPNTLRNYRERYTRDARPIIGGLRLSDVKPMHSQMILKQMEANYAGSTMRQTYIMLGTMFKSALVNGMITKHPLDNVKTTKPVKAINDINFLTVREQEKFLEVAKKSPHYLQYCFLLETGLRTGELVGLTWDKIDWEKKTLTVNKSLEYRHSTKYWRAGPPKSLSSYRTIPLTKRAFTILIMLHAERAKIKESPELSQVLEFMDLRSGKIDSFVMRDLVFINKRTGMPTKNSTYDTNLYKVCERAEIKHISMHSLRHTYATRAIERSINPKVLQKLLGHSTVQMTMDRYVHVSEDSMYEAIEKFEKDA
ncbi:MAG: tyrosine-type recombinase/integrase [Clostridia bacterium]|nr:tyrosine-type recombinase/integrase [Clostridia bacterium]